jgi:hypothetical protein
MIASIFITGVHPAEAVAANGAAADAPLANATPSATTATSAAKTLLNDFIFLSPGDVDETSSEYGIVRKPPA